MSLNETICTATAEACYVKPGACRACERTGLPILPLRRAIVPAGGVQGVTRNGMKDVPSADGMRLLREGYLYVLLDRKVWQAYQVTPEGALRQFNPNEMPCSRPQPLSTACVTQGHDAIASFLNVDTAKYKEAWLAFSDDAWPTSVLDAYKNGQAPAERFRKLELQKARNSPSDVGIGMKPDDLWIDTRVFEYAQSTEGDFQSVHGFHSRKNRLEQLRGFVRNAIQQHGLPAGVLALLLDDPVGRVQEINATRLKWVEARARWAAEPERSYRKLTSDTLLQLKQKLAQEADAGTPSYAPVSGDGPPVFRDPEIDRKEEATRRTANAHRDLEARYREPARKAFVDDYEREWAKFQRKIDEAATAWDGELSRPLFGCIIQYDYDGRVRDSGLAFARTLSQCLMGGITEASDNTDGPSLRRWQQLLKDPDSMLYRATLLCDTDLLAALRPSFNAKGEVENWNDSEKLYSALTKVIASEGAETLVYANVREAVGQLVAAMTSAATRLQDELGEGVQRAVLNANIGALLLYERVHMTQLRVRMTVGELYALQCDLLRQKQRQLAQAAERHTRQQVRSLLTSGVLSLQVNTASLAKTTIDVTLWVEGKAQDVRAKFGADLSDAGQRIGAQWSQLVVAVGTLEPQARQVLAGVRVSVDKVASIARSGWSGLKGASGSGVSLLLSVGGLYLLAEGLQQNLRKLEEQIGATHPEAVAAVYGSSMGVLGGGIEGVGLIVEASAKGVRAASGGVAAGSWVQRGAQIAKTGAIIGAVAGLFDAAQAGLASGRTWNAGDQAAARRYGGSAFLSVVGAGLAINAAAAGTTALFGGVFVLTPLGWAIVLGLSAYTVSKWAEGEESTPVERWARRCYFGVGGEDPAVHWGTSADADLAISELNAALLGMDVGVEFDDAVKIATTGTGLEPMEVQAPVLRYRFVLPRYDEVRSAYEWSLTAHRYSDFKNGSYPSGQVLANGSFLSPGMATRGARGVPAGKVPRYQDYNPATLASKAATTNGAKVVRGSIELVDTGPRHNIEAATLRVTYWPDREQADACAELILQEKW